MSTTNKVDPITFAMYRAACKAAHGEACPEAPQPRQPTEAQTLLIDAAEAFRAGRQCAGWDLVEACERLLSVDFSTVDVDFHA